MALSRTTSRLWSGRPVERQSITRHSGDSAPPVPIRRQTYGRNRRGGGAEGHWARLRLLQRVRVNHAGGQGWGGGSSRGAPALLSGGGLLLLLGANYYCYSVVYYWTRRAEPHTTPPNGVEGRGGTQILGDDLARILREMNGRNGQPTRPCADKWRH